MKNKKILYQYFRNTFIAVCVSLLIPLLLSIYDARFLNLMVLWLIALPIMLLVDLAVWYFND